MPSRDKLEDSISISMLLDFYGELLKERPRELLELYFGEDLSLSEISAMTGITRQGVRDAIRKGEAFLRETEEKLAVWTVNYNNYAILFEKFGKAKDCVGCGQCEGVCPQHLPIIEYLKKVSAHYDH